jgi:uncharacterized coiled-coil DUF342 family protein
MNKERRARIQKLIGDLEELMPQAEEIRDEEQEYFDNMPEAFQGGDKGQAAEEAISNLENVVEGIQQALDALGDIQ